jgi:Arc/MetJ-type ribon-helix-helix transcriptional regulator
MEVNNNSKTSRKELIVVTVKLPLWMLVEIEALVKLRRYNSRSDLIRTAVRELLRKEAEVLEKEKKIIKKSKEIEVIKIDEKV